MESTQNGVDQANVVEIESLYRRRDGKAAAERTALTYLVTEGPEHWSVMDRETQIARNTMGRTTYYHGTSGRTELTWEEGSMEMYHPLHDTRTEVGFTYPVTWPAGTWLLREVLLNGAEGKARIPSGQEALRHVFTAKCKNLLGTANRPRGQ